MTSAADSHPASKVEPDPQLSPAYTRYALGLLVVVYVFNFIDRSILSILLQPIKEEFQVSDTALGFLSGIAFAALYTIIGIPIARWSDRGRRSSIIALAVLVWSGMTVATGFAASFFHLVLARIGVGIGEAGCSPPAHSLISDYFPSSKRATALAIYSLGIPIGGGIGYLAGGWIEQYFDWRTAFIVVGLPGVLLALIVRLTLKEPKRGQYDDPSAQAAQERTVKQVLQFMNGLKSFRHMALAASLHAFYGYGAGAFLAAFFIRSHKMDAGEVGTWFAAIACTAGVAGTFLGGYLADRLSKRDRRWYMWVPALGTVISIPFSFFLYLSSDPYVALALYFPGSILGGMYLGPTFAMTQTLVPASMRATAAAILLFSINMIGLGLGPQGVGILSDLLAPTFGVESLRYALLFTVVSFAAWSVTHYIFAARSLRSDLDSEVPPA
ncbi:MAG: MFS transporter [Myxococcales bacterium]|nr:MFS transporter [Myxococcales bacterium]HIK86276.1 MFS transporter [Myxococcales bacterium]